ncbi:MAG TPA: cyclic nucleotide-binding domain-containing protein, partial [Pyrinomonadaceae bacterium]|nr:cyclic nucleotide-binding domain-containing protein [Pyrinomonadaceae bacterium]
MNKASSTMTLESLRSVPLFSSLDDKSVTELRELLREKHVAGKTKLFNAGEKGDAMYLIQTGRVQISIRDEDKNQVVLAELAQGDFFGEMSIIDGRQRSADASVLEDATLAVLSRDAFLTFVRTNPDVPLRMLSSLSERLRRTDDLL